MRIPAGTLYDTFEKILLQRGATAENAAWAAQNFTDSSLDGVYSHGVNRFAVLIDCIDRGLVDPAARPVCLSRAGSMERWDGRRGLGNVNARLAMDRACDLALESGMGLVALQNTNHWMRAGAYGWQAARRGCIGICWTNTMPNMPAWGSTDVVLGNNPLVIAVPRTDGDHVVFDCAMSQFSYGRLETTRRRGEQLPVPGGWDEEGQLTTDPAAVEKTRRILPMGYWKGSGLSIMLDLVAAALSGGKTAVETATEKGDETGVSQVMLAFDPSALGDDTDRLVELVRQSVESAAPEDPNHPPRMPGSRCAAIRRENQQLGVPVDEDVWQKILRLRR